MRTVLAELYREGSAAREGLLQEDSRYVLALGNEEVRMVEPGLTYALFRELISKFDYEGSTAVERRDALNEFSQIVTRVLRSDVLDWCAANGGSDAEPMQLDLVLNPAELSGLPFEVALGKTGGFLFQSHPPVILTRRIRHAFQERARIWPYEPRLLFAAASPAGAGKAVPFQGHLDALLHALKPWIQPLQGAPGAADYRKVLTVLENASLSDIAAACSAGVDGRTPFTHVHLLAHGHTIDTKDSWSQRFGLALKADDDAAQMRVVSPEQLSDALSAVAGSCIVVTVAVCYGGSQANPLIPEGGIAHTLHARGVPIVVASQWPLTFPGSEDLTRRFYSQLLLGADARDVLHQTRTALHAHAKEFLEDWASLVCYMSLPEGYADYRHDVALKSALAALETASRWADGLVVAKQPGEQTFERVAGQFAERAADLEKLLSGSAGARGHVVGENLGLLGSAHKRFAELYHCWNQVFGDDVQRKALMLDYLGLARDWYSKGAERDLSDHWVATQSLSLEAVLTGGIKDSVWWQIAHKAAQLATLGSNPHWGWGSLAELHLLAPATGRPADSRAAEHALKQLVACNPGLAAIRATRRQLQRYRTWWTRQNGFFPNTEDLAAPATKLVDLLEAGSAGEV